MIKNTTVQKMVTASDTDMESKGRIRRISRLNYWQTGMRAVREYDICFDSGSENIEHWSSILSPKLEGFITSFVRKREGEKRKDCEARVTKFIAKFPYPWLSTIFTFEEAVKGTYGVREGTSKADKDLPLRRLFLKWVKLMSAHTGSMFGIWEPRREKSGNIYYHGENRLGDAFLGRYFSPFGFRHSDYTFQIKARLSSQTRRSSVGFVFRARSRWSSTFYDVFLGHNHYIAQSGLILVKVKGINPYTAYRVQSAYRPPGFPGLDRWYTCRVVVTNCGNRGKDVNIKIYLNDDDRTHLPGDELKLRIDYTERAKDRKCETNPYLKGGIFLGIVEPLRHTEGDFDDLLVWASKKNKNEIFFEGVKPGLKVSLYDKNDQLLADGKEKEGRVSLCLWNPLDDTVGATVNPFEPFPIERGYFKVYTGDGNLKHNGKNREEYFANIWCGDVFQYFSDS